MAGVRLSHPDRVLYPAIGLTKLGLARYYERIAEWMLPHISGRPLTLVRCPNGVGTSCFYMKHAHVWAPPALRRIKIQEKTKTGEYLIADSAAALVALAQMDVLEIHTWGSRAAHLEQPDRLVFDLDPGPRVPWPRVVEAARLVKRALELLDLGAFLKTTGGSGLHIVVPLQPHANWAECLEFAREFAETVARHDPARYTTVFAKAGREDKILIDYLRNNRTATAVAPYSTRARAEATVSVPIAWEELNARMRSDRFTVRAVEQRVSRLKRDPWAGLDAAARPLPGTPVRVL
ncbi:MAG: non-homologous end-joining DNA ligase [Candidatus Binatia bacterium]